MLFPLVGASGGGRIRHKGASYAIPMHGFASDAEFRLLREDGGGCEFSLMSSLETRAVYPFDFELRIGFALEGSSIRQSISVHNPSDDPILVQCGLHPGFTLPAGSEGASPVVVLEQDEAAEVRQLRGGHRCAHIPNPVRNRILDIQPSTFEHGGILFDEVRSTWVWHGRGGGKGILFRRGDFPQLALWSKGSAEFLCIEPWQGAPDEEDFTGPLAQKDNIVVIPSGSDLMRHCTMVFGALKPDPDIIDHTSHII